MTIEPPLTVAACVNVDGGHAVSRACGFQNSVCASAMTTIVIAA
jgi:hypothetical protein